MRCTEDVYRRRLQNKVSRAMTSSMIKVDSLSIRKSRTNISSSRRSLKRNIKRPITLIYVLSLFNMLIKTLPIKNYTCQIIDTHSTNNNTVTSNPINAKNTKTNNMINTNNNQKISQSNKIN